MRRKSMRMGQSGPPPRVVCAPALMGKSDAPLNRAHRCYVATRSWNSSQKEAAVPSVWALGSHVPTEAVCFRMARTGQ